MMTDFLVILSKYFIIHFDKVSNCTGIKSHYTKPTHDLDYFVIVNQYFEKMSHYFDIASQYIQKVTTYSDVLNEDFREISHHCKALNARNTCD